MSVRPCELDTGGYPDTHFAPGGVLLVLPYPIELFARRGIEVSYGLGTHR